MNTQLSSLVLQLMALLVLGFCGPPRADAQQQWYALLVPRTAPTAAPISLAVYIPDDIFGEDAITKYGEGHRAVLPPLTGYSLHFYREQGPDWLGPSGFYYGVFKTPLAPMESKTWDGIYAWASGAEAPAGVASYLFSPGGARPPAGYTARLELDYVPPELGYTGPWTFPFDPGYPWGVLFDIPVPNVTDPLQGTRMHIVVTAPVPEPSSLLALSAGLAGMAGVMRRRSAVRPRHERRGEG